jgi:uncharacterized protein
MTSVVRAAPSIEPIARVIERLVERLQPEEIWLLGSRAEGRAREGSDYDLLAVLPNDVAAEQLDPIAAWENVRGMGVPVDVIPCTRSEFEEEKLEIDSLPRAAWEKGWCIFMALDRRIRAYLDLAEQDLDAGAVLAKAGNRYAAYHCQQAVEKLLKALLLRYGIEAGVEHRLDVLLSRLDEAKTSEAGTWKAALGQFERYSPFATTFRYPTPGGRIPAPPPAGSILPDVTALRDLLARARSELISA